MSGLLQTEDYAKALLRTYPGVTDEAVAARLANRMERQRRVLMRENPRLAWFHSMTCLSGLNSCDPGRSASPFSGRTQLAPAVRFRVR